MADCTTNTPNTTSSDDCDSEIVNRQITTKLSYGSESDESEYEGEGFEDYEDSNSAYSIYQRSFTPHFVDQTKTFNQRELDEIERNNAILMDKIMANNKRKNQYAIPPKVINIKKEASASINRRKKQEVINRENQILLKKLQSVKSTFNYKK